MISLLRGFVMAGDAPSAEDAVPSFLHALTWASLFACIDALVAGKWIISGATLLAALVFHVVGIKWPQIKSGTHFNWPLWDRWIAGATRVAQVVVVLTVISIAFTTYYAIRKARNSETQTSSQEHVLKSQNTLSTPSSVQCQTSHVPPVAQRKTHKTPSEPGESGEQEVPSKTAQHVDWHDKQNWRHFLPYRNDQKPSTRAFW